MNLSTRTLFRGLSFITFVIGVSGVAFFIDTFSSVEAAKDRAERIIELCEGEKAPYKPTCYEREVPGLMDGGSSMKETVDVVRSILTLDTDFKYCHVLAHKIAAKEVAKDPSRWKEVVKKAPLDICSYGFLHGAFQERFRTESFPPESPASSILPLFEGVCTDEYWESRTGGEQVNCVHALGHLMLYVTNADLHKAVVVCEGLPDLKEYDLRRACSEGVFMQLYQPLEPEDFALVEGKDPKSLEERDRLCAEFSGRARAMCIKESWPLDLDVVRSPERLEGFCLLAAAGADEEEEYCLSALSYIVAARTQFNAEKFAAFCERMPSRAGRCFRYGSPRFLEIYQKDVSPSLMLCERAKEFGESDDCYELLAQYSGRTFQPGSEEAETLCASLPPPWKESCSGYTP